MKYIKFKPSIKLLIIIILSTLLDFSSQARLLSDSVKIPDKIYLSTDKPFYTVEETLYYKVYLLDGQSHIPKLLNSVVNVHLLNDKNEVIVSQTLQTNKGVSNGEIFLADTLIGGTYSIIAYNNWSKNFSSSLLCSKRIEILNFYQSPVHPFAAINPEQKKYGKNLIENSKAAPNSSAGLEFYPEGGNLVEGLTSRVGFRVVDQNGKGVGVIGIVSDENGNKITAFSSNSFGIGSFILNPKPMTTYKAIFTLDSMQHEVNLPKPLTEGVVISAENLDEVIQVKVAGKWSNPDQDLSATLEASAKGKVFYSSQVNLVKKDPKFFIPKKYFPVGIVKIALTKDKKTLSERLIFLEDTRKPIITISTKKSHYSPREMVEVEVDIKDQEGKPVEGSYSVTVLDGRQIPEIQNSDNLYSNLLLTSEIKDPIKNPTYYFSTTGDSVKHNLDLLLLTQGSGNYTWDGLKYSHINYPKEKGKFITGKVLDINGKPSPIASVVVTYPGFALPFHYTSTDKEGRFSFPVKHTGIKELIITARSAGSIKEDLNIILDDGKLEFDVLDKNKKRFIDENAFYAYFLTAAKMVRIKEAFKTADSARIFREVEEPDSLNAFEADANPLIKLKDFQHFSTMREVIQEIVPGFKFKKTKKGLEVRLLNLESKLFYTGEPLYFIDNVLVNSLQNILDLDPSLVENVVLIRERSKLLKFGPLAIDGIFAVHTIDRNYTTQNLKNTLYLNYRGYHQGKDFNFPEYSDSGRKRSQPDFRPTIYWKADLRTNKEGKAKVTFYNSDAVGPIKVIVEGISSDGIPAVKEFIYNVKPKTQQ